MGWKKKVKFSIIFIFILVFLPEIALADSAQPKILLVRDAHFPPYTNDVLAPYYQTALQHWGYEYDTYTVTESGDNGPNNATMSQYDIVIWFTGNDYGGDFPTLTQTDRTEVRKYLDSGGKLFLTGQDIGYDIGGIGTEDLGGVEADFYEDYLHAEFGYDYNLDKDLVGITSDSIGHGLIIDITGGAENQKYPSVIGPADGYANGVFDYQRYCRYVGWGFEKCTSGVYYGAIRADTGVYKVSYFAFGFEGLSLESNRNVIMKRVVEYLYTPYTKDTLVSPSLTCDPDQAKCLRDSDPVVNATCENKQLFGTINTAEFFKDSIGTSGAGTAMNASDGSFSSATENVNGSVDVTGLSDGSHTVYVHCKDSDGYWGKFDNYNFTIDNTEPSEGRLNLSDGSDYTGSGKPKISINLRFSCGSYPEFCPDYMQFSCDNSNWTGWVSFTTPYYGFNITNASVGCSSGDGNRTVYYRTKDSAGNLQDGTLDYPQEDWVVLDREEPSVQITIPANNSWVSDSTPDFAFKFTDSLASTANCTLYVDGNGVGSNSSVLNNTATTITSSTLSEGARNWYINCTDLASNRGKSETRTLNIDTTHPNTAFGTNPADNYNSSNQTVVFDLKCSDSYAVNTSQLWGNWSGWHANQTNSTPINNSYWNVTVTGIPEGRWKWGIYCNDSSGNQDWSDTNRTLTVDVTSPTVNIVLPENETYASSSVSLNYTAVDNIGIGSCSYSKDGEDNQSLAGCGNTTLTGLTDDSHNITVWASDAAGNVNSHTVYFSVDTVYPLISYNTDTTTEGNHSQNYIFVNVSITETNIDTVTLDFNGTNETMTQNDSSNWWVNKTSLSEGTYTIKVYVNDTAGHTNSTGQRSITLDVTSPAFSGYQRNPDPPNEDQSVQVNITVTESNLDKVILEWNGSTNYTVTSYSGSEYYFAINIGNYTAHDLITYKWFANDTAGNVNWSVQQSFTVGNQIPTLTSISANVTYAKQGDYVKITTSGASDSDAEDAYRLMCGSVENTYDYCNSTYSTGERNCSFASPWSDDVSHTIHCKLYDTYGYSSDKTTSVTADNTGPSISGETNTSVPNEDGWIQINATVTDSGVGLDKVWVEITNSTGSYNTTVTAYVGNEYYYNMTSVWLKAHDTISWRYYSNDTLGNEGGGASKSFTVVNRQPSVSAPALNDTAPKTDYILNCTGGVFSDDDGGDSESNRQFKWYLNGSEISGESSATLDLNVGGNGNKSDQIKCSIRVYDGYDWSDWVNSSNTATVVDSPPTQPDQPTVTPATAYTTSLLTSSDGSGSTDADGDTITYYYLFNDTSDSATLQDWSTTKTFDCNTNGCDKGDVIRVYVKAVTSEANSSVSTAGTKAISDSRPTDPTSLNLTETVRVTDELNATCSGSTDADNDTITYNFEFYDVNDTSVVQAYSSDYNYTLTTSEAHDLIRVRCKANTSDANSSGYKEANRSVTDTPPTTPTDLSLTAGDVKVTEILTGTCSDSTDADSDSITYHYEFYNTNGTSTLQAYSSDNTYVIQQTDAHDLIRVRCKATTTYANSSGYDEENKSIANTLPVIGSPDLNDTTPRTDYTLLCTNGSYTDADGDNANWYYRWWEQDGGSGDFAIISGQTANTSDLTLSGLDKGDVLKCSTIASDGEANATDWTNSSSATIQNSPPEFDFNLSTQTVYHSENLTYDINCSDADLDGITYYDNATLFDINPTSGLIEDDPVQSDTGNYSIKITCGDGTVNVTDTFVYDVENYKPTASSVDIKPDNPNSGDNLTCNYTYSDTDNDDENGTTFEWYKNDSAQNINSQILLSGNTSGGEEWICEVRPKDGLDFGDRVNSTREIIGSSAPSIVTYTDDSTPTNPTNVGSYVNFTVDWSDPDQPVENARIYVCNESDITSSGCGAGDKTFCSTSNANTDPISCQYTTLQSDSETVTYYVIVCDDSDLCSPVEQSEFSVNHAPSVSDAVINPTTAYTNDTLTCNYTFTDNDTGDTDSSTYEWYKNDVAQNINSQTLSSGNTTKGDNWTCEINPIDNHNFAGTKVNTTGKVISNSPPVLTDIPNQNANTTDSWTYQVDCSDSDSDPLTYYDNVTEFDINQSGYIEWSPNESNVGELGVLITCGDGVANATDTFKITVSDTTPPTWSNNETNASGSTKTAETVYFNVTLGDGYQGGYYVFSYDYGSGSFSNETPATWTSPEEITDIKTITGTGGQTVRWKWYFNDSSGNINSTDEWSFTVANTQPTIGSPTLNTTTPQTDDAIKCNNGSFTDVDNDTANWYYRWWEQNQGSGSFTAISGQTSNILTLTLSGLDKGDVINCSTIASDGEANATDWTNSSLATIQNSPPSTPTTLSPENGTYGGVQNTVSINCSGSTDADGDTINYSIAVYYDSAWYLLEYQGDGLYEWDVSSISSQAGVDIRCNATDQTNDSAYFNPGGTLTIDNAEPTITHDFPSNGTSFSYAPHFNGTCTDSSGISLVWTNITEYSDYDSNSPYNFTNITSLTNQRYVVRIFCNDTLNNTATLDFYFTYDDTNPEISYNPTTTTEGNRSQNWILINVSLTETNLDTISYEFDNVNYTDWDGNDSLNYWVNKTGLSESTHTFYVWANDTAGNYNRTATRVVTLDTTSPAISLTSPNNNTWQNVGVTLDFDVTDTNLDTVLWSNDSYTNNRTFTSPFQINTSSWSEAVTGVYVWANDSAGNTNEQYYRWKFDSGSSPTITLVSPANNSVINTGTVINLSVSDTGELNTTWYNNGTANYTLTSPFDINTTGWPEEQGKSLDVWANDSSGNLEHEYYRFDFDDTLPIVNIAHPQNRTYNTATLWLNYTSSDTNLNMTWYDYNDTNTTLTGNTTFTALDNQVSTLTLYANDSAGNTNSASVTFTVDTTSPTAYFGTNAIDNYNSSSQSITFDLKCSDNIAVSTLQLWANWTGTWSINHTNSTPVNDSYLNVTVYGIPEGRWKWGVYCNDSSGNSDWSDTNRTLTVDVTEPVITIDTPSNASYLNYAPYINGTVVELYPGTIWTNVTEYGNLDTSSPFNFTNTSSLSQGRLDVNVSANDSAGNIGSAEVSFIYDSVAPYIISITPSNDSHLKSSDNITISVNDTLSGVNFTWYNSGGGSNQTFTDGVSFNPGWATNGPKTLDVWVNDSAGNVNHSVYIFVVDDSAPLTWNYGFDTPDPYYNDVRVYVSDSTTFFVNVSDVTNVSVVIATLRNATGNETNHSLSPASNNYTNDTWSFSYTNTNELGIYNITKLYVNDSLGNADVVQGAEINSSFRVVNGSLTLLLDNSSNIDAGNNKTFNLTFNFNKTVNNPDLILYIPPNNPANPNQTPNYTNLSIYECTFNTSCSIEISNNSQTYPTFLNLTGSGKDNILLLNNSIIQARTPSKDTNYTWLMSYKSLNYVSTTRILTPLLNITQILCNGGQSCLVNQSQQFTLAVTVNNEQTNNHTGKAKDVYVRSNASIGTNTSLLGDILSGSNKTAEWVINVTEAGNYTFTFDSWDNLTNTYNATQQSVLIQVKDTEKPNITKTEWEGDNLVNVNDSITYYVTARDNTNISTIWLTVNDTNSTETNYTLDFYIGTLHYGIWNLTYNHTTEVGTYNITVIYVNDTAGNLLAHSPTGTSAGFEVRELNINTSLSEQELAVGEELTIYTNVSGNVSTIERVEALILKPRNSNETVALNLNTTANEIYQFIGVYSNISRSGNYTVNVTVYSANNATNTKNFSVPFGNISVAPAEGTAEDSVYYLNLPNQTVYELGWFILPIEGDVGEVNGTINITDKNIVNLTAGEDETKTWNITYEEHINGRLVKWGIRTNVIGETNVTLYANSPTLNKSNQTTLLINVTPPDTESPNILDFYHDLNETNLLEPVKITVNATDNTVVSNVTVEVVYPFTQNVTAEKTYSGLYEGEFNNTNQTGTFSYKIFVSDVSGNSNESTTSKNFTVSDTYNVSVNPGHDRYNKGEYVYIDVYVKNVNNQNISGFNSTLILDKDGTNETLLPDNQTDQGYYLIKTGDNPTTGTSVYKIYANVSKNGNTGNSENTFNVTKRLTTAFVSPRTGDYFGPGEDVPVEISVTNGRGENVTDAVVVSYCDSCEINYIRLDHFYGGKYVSYSFIAPSDRWFALNAYAIDQWKNDQGGGEDVYPFVTLTTQPSTESADGGDGAAGGGGGPAGVVTPGCNCTSWTNQGCGSASCKETEMYQTRVCTPAGCASESQCIVMLECIAEKDFELSINPKIIEMKQGEDKTIIGTLKNNGETKLTLNIGVTKECCSVDMQSRFELEKKTSLDFTILLHSPLFEKIGEYVITFKVKENGVEQTKKLKVMVIEHEYVTFLKDLEIRLPDIKKDLESYKKVDVEVENLIMLADEIEMYIENAKTAIREDNFDLLTAYVYNADKNAQRINSGLTSLRIKKFLFENRWNIIGSLIIIFLASFFLTQIIIPYRKLRKEIKKLMEKEKIVTGTKVSAEEQYFTRKIDKRTFVKIMTEEHDKVLRVRSTIKEKKTAVHNLLSAKHVLRMFFKFPLLIAKKIKNAVTKGSEKLKRGVLKVKEVEKEGVKKEVKKPEKLKEKIKFVEKPEEKPKVLKPKETDIENIEKFRDLIKKGEKAVSDKKFDEATRIYSDIKLIYDKMPNETKMQLRQETSRILKMYNEIRRNLK